MTHAAGSAIEPYDDNEHIVIEAEQVSATEVAERSATFATVYTASDDERRPIVPAWVRNRDERRAMCVTMAVTPATSPRGT